jgi:hypothetical protein
VAPPGSRRVGKGGHCGAHRKRRASRTRAAFPMTADGGCAPRRCQPAAVQLLGIRSVENRKSSSRRSAMATPVRPPPSEATASRSSRATTTGPPPARSAAKARTRRASVSSALAPSTATPTSAVWSRSWNGCGNS